MSLKGGHPERWSRAPACRASRAPPNGPLQEKVAQHRDERTKGLAEVEREHILSTLQETGWRIEGPKGAANSLG